MSARRLYIVQIVCTSFIFAYGLYTPLNSSHFLKHQSTLFEPRFDSTMTEIINKSFFDTRSMFLEIPQLPLKNLTLLEHEVESEILDPLMSCVRNSLRKLNDSCILYNNCTQFQYNNASELLNSWKEELKADCCINIHLNELDGHSSQEDKQTPLSDQLATVNKSLCNRKLFPNNSQAISNIKNEIMNKTEMLLVFLTSPQNDNLTAKYLPEESYLKNLTTSTLPLHIKGDPGTLDEESVHNLNDQAGRSKRDTQTHIVMTRTYYYPEPRATIKVTFPSESSDADFEVIYGPPPPKIHVQTVVNGNSQFKVTTHFDR